MNRENIYLIEGEEVFARLVEFSFNIHIEGTAIESDRSMLTSFSF
jgi:hypothetical protein